MELDPIEELWNLGGNKTMRTSGTAEALSSASRKLEGKNHSTIFNWSVSTNRLHAHFPQKQRTLLT